MGAVSGPCPSAPLPHRPSPAARPATSRGAIPLRPLSRSLSPPVAGPLQGFLGPGPRLFLQLP
eukprot:11655520-Alexandrium_andersonii.AAC.1